MDTLRRFLSPAIMVAVFALDRLTKMWVMKVMFLGESRPFLPFFSLTYIENTGVAFGLGRNNNRIFIVVGIVLFSALLYLRRRWRKNHGLTPALETGFGLVMGGALGNIYDRIVYGSVVDFLDFFAGAHHWPAFNVADSAICVGACILAFTQVPSAKAKTTA